MSNRALPALCHCGIGILLLCRTFAGVSAAKSDQEETYDARFFLRIIQNKGPEGVLSRLYVEPPDLMTPLFSGIETGRAEWLAVYDKLRRASDEITAARLDDSLARALSNATGPVLSYLHAHRDIPIAMICGRTGYEVSVPSGVLEPRELLSLGRRQKKLSRTTSADIEAERLSCLAKIPPLLQRQIRIYLASHGARDTTSTAVSKLSVSEKNELRDLVASGQSDQSVSARRNGSLPDGPFRLLEIPAEAVGHCTGGPRRTANPEGPWEGTDGIADRSLPRVRLLNACQIAPEEWEISCEHGGFSPHFRRVRVRKIGGKDWTAMIDERIRPSYAPGNTAIDALWADCHSLPSWQETQQKNGSAM